MLASPLGSSETHILRIFDGVTKKSGIFRKKWDLIGKNGVVLP
jgi:hypothetical protein